MDVSDINLFLKRKRSHSLLTSGGKKSNLFLLLTSGKMSLFVSGTFVKYPAKKRVGEDDA
jgi:hypothetical protein